MGLRGGRDVNRKALEAAHGFDLKYAIHTLRLGLQGLEFMRPGRITLPMPEPHRQWLRLVRAGEVPLVNVISRLQEIEGDLLASFDSSPLPVKPDAERVERFILEAYAYHWDRQEQIPGLHAPAEPPWVVS